MVADDVPLLVSAGVLRSLHAVLDIGSKTYDFKSIASQVPVITVDSGHVGFKILPVDEVRLGELLEIDWQAFIDAGSEVADFAGQQDQGLVSNR